MLQLLEYEHLNTDDVIDTTPFEPVMSRKHRKSPAIRDPAPNPPAADMPANAQVSHGVTARFVTRFNLWLRHDLWPHNASICDPARFETKSASICDQRYTMI